MKKSNLILLTAIILMSLTFVTGHAQVAMNSSREAFTNEDGIYSNPRSVATSAVNGKAQKNFKKDYRQAVESEWSALVDNSLMCRFSLKNIPYRAFYTAHGQWLYTVSSYDASKLDKTVYDKIKSVYYNSSIVFVNQIDMVKGRTIYIVEVQDEKLIRKIRLEDDEMEVIQELEKH
jgi:hypothetical protein